MWRMCEAVKTFRLWVTVFVDRKCVSFLRYGYDTVDLFAIGLFVRLSFHGFRRGV